MSRASPPDDNTTDEAGSASITRGRTSAPPPTDRERAALLRLLLTDGLGSIRITRLLSRFGSACEALRQRRAAWVEVGVPGKLHSEASRIAQSSVRDLSIRLDVLETQVIAYHDAGYPCALRHVHDAPPVLLVQGDTTCLKAPCVAVVGARRASSAGRGLATGIAGKLAAAGCTVVSGLARGIDGAAHRGALEAHGRTVAVVGCGLDRVYPHQHRALAREIVDGGAVVSEYLPGVAPRPGHFPRRNRIIAGLSTAVIVVEADVRSGSLITANLALEAGREVFAVPGGVQHAGSRGCNALIRDGARLVRSAEDVMEDLGLPVGKPQKPASTPFVPAIANDQLTAEIAAELAAAPLHIDALVSVTDTSAARVMQALQWLQISGLAEPISGGNWTLTTDLPIAFDNHDRKAAKRLAPE